VPATIATRRATIDDVDAVLRDVQAGFDSYVAFAPFGWQPPQIMPERERTVALLEHPRTWALLALADAATVGHVGFMPARERTPGAPRGSLLARPEIPGLAHLWQLFVLPEWWGRGVAPALHDAAVAEMAAQGYYRARLLTPSLHTRARRFYERRGWAVAGEEWNEDLVLMLTEYQLALR
jgi:GNAT superfamily N-acetyltransferase